MAVATTTILAAVAITTAAAATATSVISAKASKKARQTQNRLAALKARRERIQQVREARIKAGTIRNRAAVGGIGESSSAITGESGVRQQAVSNLNFIDQSTDLQQEINTLAGRSEFFGSLSGLFSDVSQQAQNPRFASSLKTLFK